VRGYVVVFEGDDASGYSAYSPDLPGVVAAGETRQETERLMLEAMAEHIALLRDSGQPIPQPAEAASVTMLDPPPRKPSAVGFGGGSLLPLCRMTAPIPRSA
jgi:predicted RNase H-like HicB family nuclease